MNNIRVFMASPGDLKKERGLFKDVIESLNIGFGDGADVKFIADGWEDQNASTGKRVQELFNEKIDKCDVFILALHMRWGQNAEDAKPYTSYTEEEFYRAYNRFKKNGKPEIYVFYKNINLDKQIDPDNQLKRVIEFKKTLENNGDVWPRTFEGDNDFKGLIDTHLRGYVKGELNQKNESINLPEELVQKIHEQQIELAEDAILLAQEGKIEFARDRFATLLGISSNTYILHLAFCFYIRVADYSAAQSTIERWFEVTGKDNQTKEISQAYSNLGLIFREHGEYRSAKKMYEKSLNISKLLDNKMDIARDYEDLGVLSTMIGDFDDAEKALKDSLRIRESINSTYIGHSYNSLGNLYLDQLKFESAEIMFQKSLTLAQKIDDKIGIAHAYGNLGIIYSEKSDRSTAIEFFNKSIEAHKLMGSKKDLATNLGNLANQYLLSGEVELAENAYRESLSIEEEINNQEGMATDYGNLGLLFFEKNDPFKAEQMYLKSLSIYELLGINSGVYRALLNLGELYEMKNNISKAISVYERGVKIARLLKSDERVQVMLNKLELVYFRTGKLAEVKKNIQEQMTLKTASKNKAYMASLNSRIGVAHAGLNEYEMAEAAFKDSIDLYSETNNKENIKKTYRNLFSLNINRGNYVEAIKNFIMSL
jgi:tetratricopeptide (TPR) repeat protein